MEIFRTGGVQKQLFFFRSGFISFISSLLLHNKQSLPFVKHFWQFLKSENRIPPAPRPASTNQNQKTAGNEYSNQLLKKPPYPKKISKSKH